MDEAARRRWSAIAHHDRAFASPLDTSRFAALVGQLDLQPLPYSVDFGCGKGEALRTVVREAGGTGTGIDRSAEMLAGADSLNGAITFVEADARTWLPDRPADLAICIGSTHIFGDGAAAAAALAGLVRPGGVVLIGDGYWRDEPPPSRLEEFGMRADELVELATLVEGIERAGLTPVAVQPSTLVEWDDYEWSLIRSVERWARQHPPDPDREAFLGQTRLMRDSYLQWRREFFGFALVAGVAAGS